MRKWYILIGAMYFFCAMQGQGILPPSDIDINVIAEPEGSDILLKWAPVGYAAWAWGNTHGYRVERTTTVANGDTLDYASQSASRVVLATAVMPLSQQALEDLSDTSDMAGLALAAIYSDTFNVVLSLDDIATAYNNTLEEQNRYGLGLFAADYTFTMAEYMGLALRDTTAQGQHEYRYKVFPNGDTNGINVRAGLVISSLTMQRPLLELEDMRYDAMGSNIIVNWRIPIYNNAYTSYVVERSENDGQTYEQRNAHPVVYSGNQGYDDFRASYLDSLQSPQTTYVYRVRGRTPFGKFGPYSDTLHVSFEEAPLAIQPSVDGITELPTADMKIDWEFPSDVNDQISGFNVYRSGHVNGPFEPINATLIDAADRSFVDTNPGPINYYQIEVVEPNGTKTTSFKKLIQRFDDTAPAPPTNIEAEVSESGLATISWAPNTEDDIMGYRVFYSNQANGNYTQITPRWIVDTTMTYQLNMASLSKQVFVKVAALDFKENTSLHSAAKQVEKPDIHPPAKPTLILEERSQGAVNLSFSQSASPDVQEHQIQRRIANTPNWKTVETIPAPSKSTTFSDAAFDSQENFTYEYRLLAIDQVGNRSSSKIVAAQPLDSGLRDAVQSIIVSKSNQGLRVYWAYPDVTGVVLFQIYREKDDTGLRAYAAVAPERAIQSAAPADDPNMPDNIHFLYIDEDAIGGSTYTYQVMAIHAGGATSPMSNATSIQY